MAMEVIHQTSNISPSSTRLLQLRVLCFSKMLPQVSNEISGRDFQPLILHVIALLYLLRTF